LKNATRFSWPAFAWLMITTLLLCLPASSLPKTGGDWLSVIYADKWVHLAVFALLSFLFCKSLIINNLPRKTVLQLYFFIAALSALYGIFMEFVQKWLIPGRSFELTDILADTAGSFLGFLFAFRRYIKLAGKASI
jgi:VanZ family protein